MHTERNTSEAHWKLMNQFKIPDWLNLVHNDELLDNRLSSETVCEDQVQDFFKNTKGGKITE